LVFFFGFHGGIFEYVVLAFSSLAFLDFILFIVNKLTALNKVF